MDPSCSLCRPDLAPIVAESVYWRLVLNTNQRFLGACFWVLKRQFASSIDSSQDMTRECAEPARQVPRRILDPRHVLRMSQVLG